MNPYGQSTGGSGGSGYGGGSMTVGDYANGMPNIRLSQIPASFMRQLPWMIPALIIMAALSWWFTKDIKREYQADGRIMVQAGVEHIYDPVTGTSNAGINITADQITLTEASIIKNPATIDKVISQMTAPPSYGGVGGERFAPKLYKRWADASSANKADRRNDLVKFVNESFVVMPKAKSSIINLIYKHEDGDVAVQTLDTFMTTYLDFRNDIFVSEASGLIAEQLTLTQDQLDSVDSKIQSILNRNNISEFDSEKTGVQKRSEALRAELNSLRGKMSGVEAALAATENQLRNTQATIDLQVDDRASQRLAQAQLERRQLLAKYLPSSNPVRAKEAEISEIRAQISANGGKPAGGRRVGPNTVYQALMTQRNTYQAQADSFREQEITLQAQLNTTISKVKHMRVLGPKYQNLIREKTTLEERVKGLNAKEQAALAKQQQQNDKMDNITVISRPVMARKGRNMSKIMFALATLGSLFTVFMLALLRVFLDPNLYGPRPRNASSIPTAAPDYTQAYPQSYEYAGQPSIPEAVPAYMPAAAEYGAGEYGAPQYPPAQEAQNYQGYEAQTYEAQSYAAPYEQPYAQQAPAPVYETPVYETPAYETPAHSVPTHSAPAHELQEHSQQAYADNTATANPYLNTGAVPQPTQAQVQEYAGTDQSIPVLGHALYSVVPDTQIG